MLKLKCFSCNSGRIFRGKILKWFESPHLCYSGSLTGISLSLHTHTTTKVAPSSDRVGKVGKDMTCFSLTHCFLRAPRHGCPGSGKNEQWEGRPRNNQDLYRAGHKTSMTDIMTPSLLQTLVVLLLHSSESQCSCIPGTSLPGELTQALLCTRQKPAWVRCRFFVLLTTHTHFPEKQTC